MARDESGSQQRRYGGVPAGERRARRRRAFLDAATEVIGTEGYRALRIRSLCRRAGLTDRYFYEEFGSLEDVLSIVYAETMERVFTATLAEVAPPGAVAVEQQTYRLLDAFIRTVTADHQRARIQLIEVVGVSPRIERERRAVVRRFSSMLAEGIRERDLADDGLVDIDLTCVALVGAVDELLVAWINGEVGDDIDAIVRAATALFVRAFLDERVELDQGAR
jgi:AcrR family transcriptional regulator